MKSSLPLLIIVLSLAACDPDLPGPATTPASPSATAQNALFTARRGFTTHLLRSVQTGIPADTPPAGILRLVKYGSPAGDLSAYVTPAPAGGQKHPAIIWLFGGFSNSIGDTAWERADPENDQSARAFREEGLVMMYPSLRGGNDNPGVKEAFFGEVDDVIAAADYLATLDYVDPRRIYLGGHSTGGTLAILVAESSSRFRAVFAFGPVDDVAGYGQEDLPFDISNRDEARLRAPKLWLSSVRSPTFVLEGTADRSNIESLRSLQAINRNLQVHFVEAEGHNHFSILAPVTRVVAKKLLADTAETPAISFSPQDVAR